MRLLDAIRLSESNLRKNPIRTCLTILGLGVGIGAILTVITLGQAGEVQVEREIARLGVDKVWVKATGDRPLEATSGEALAAIAELNACADAATAGIVTWSDGHASCLIGGYDSSFAAVYAPQLMDGRLFAPHEYKGSAVAIVDEVLAKQIGPEVLGRLIDVGSRRMRIVGVIAPLTSGFIARTEGTVLLPLTTFLDTYPHPVDQVTITIPEHLTADETGRIAVAALAKSGGAYEATSMQEEIEAVEQVVRIFVMVLACVAAVCMLTGAIGVMNILLVSVRERRREIGLMKAIGGTAAQVGALFLLEAVCYAVLGSLLGLLLALILIRCFGDWIGLSASLSIGVALPTIALAALMGMIFGVTPALRAAAMQPVDALKQEP